MPSEKITQHPIKYNAITSFTDGIIHMYKLKTCHKLYTNIIIHPGCMVYKIANEIFSTFGLSEIA